MLHKIISAIFGIFYSRLFYKNILSNVSRKHYIISLSTIFLLLSFIFFPQEVIAQHERLHEFYFFNNIPSFNIDQGKLVFEKPIAFYSLEQLTKKNSMMRFMTVRNKAKILHSMIPVILTEKNIYLTISHTFKIIFPYQNFYIKKINAKHILQANNVFFSAMMAFNLIKTAVAFLLCLWIAERIDFIANRSSQKERNYFIFSMLCFIPCLFYILFLTYSPIHFNDQYIVVPLLYAGYFFMMHRCVAFE